MAADGAGALTIEVTVAFCWLATAAQTPAVVMEPGIQA
jgi:hypothetical protein